MKHTAKTRHNSSIRSMLISLLLVFGLSLGLVLVMSFNTILSLQKDFSAAVSNNASIQSLHTRFSAEQDSLFEMIRSPGEASVSHCLTLFAETDRDLSGMTLTLHDQETLLLLRATVLSHEQYGLRLQELSEAIIGSEYKADTDEEILLYRELLLRGTYIDLYIEEMKANSIHLEEIVYSQVRDRIRMVVPLFFIVGGIVLLCNILLTVRVIRHILPPLSSLHRASLDLQNGIYAEDEIPIYYQDEIGDLTTAFLHMRRQIRSTIDALNERNRLENDLHKREMQAAQMEALLEEARFQYLQSQINPHFLYNSLNTISIYAMREGADTTYDLLLHLASIYRYYTYDIRDATVTLRQELEMVSNYMFLHKTRFLDRVRWELRSDPAAEELKIPKFLLQPLVENSLVHGLADREHGTLRLETALIAPHTVRIEIADDGCGFDPDAIKEGQNASSMTHGLQNVQTRLGIFSPESTFTIHSVIGQGTTIVMELVCPDDAHTEVAHDE